MKKINLLNSVQNYASRLLMLLCVLTLGIGSAWAGGSHSTHTATLNVAKGTGEGSVYAASSETATSGSESASFNCGGSSSGTHKGDLYAFATPKDGYTFKGWSESATSPEGADKANPLKVSFDVTDASSSKTYYAHFQKKVLATITFKAAANGTYTAKAGSTTKTVSTSDQSITTDESIDFTAIPASGYKFFGWYTSADGGTTRKYFSYSASATNNVFTENVNVYAEFISTSVATFNVKGTSDHYYDLAKGLTAAASSSSKVLVAASNGTVAAGAYTIPNGVTLLIPYESTNSVTTTPKDVQTWASLSEYRKLKLAADANLTVENGGAICLAGQQWGTSSSNPGPGSVLGAYSVLDMSEGGHITVANGGKLYAFGFIVGKGNQSTSGTITIQNGGTVYEDLAINDLHGGGGTAACVNGTSASNSYGLFPFSQYFIQNIEPKMTLEYGAVEKAYYDIQSSQGGQQGAIDFIGSTDSYMFQMLTGASVTKWYDATSDYQCYEVRGKMTMNSLTVSAGSYMKMTSSKFVLPVNNNMEITAKTGATIDMPYSTKFQPGSKLIIEEGAVVDVRKELYFYDYQDWDKYAIAYAQTYGISTSGKKITWHTLRDVSAPSKLGHASLVLNGTINLNEGAAFYTTSHGGNITCTTGTGRIVYNVAGKTTGKDLYECWSTYGKKEGGTALAQGETNKAEGQVQVGKFSLLKTWYIFGTPVATTPAQLKNADGSYLATAGAAANTTITYANGHWGWKEIWKNGTTELASAITIAKTNNAAAQNALLNDIDAPKGYSLVWETIETDETLAHQEVVHTVGNQAINYTITYNLNGGSVTNANPDSYTIESAAITLNNPTKLGHTFAGWTGTGLNNAQKDVTIAHGSTGNMTYEATWTVNQYPVVWNNYDDASIAEDQVDFGTVPSYTGETPTHPMTTEYVYTFSGWDPSLVAVGIEGATYTAVYTYDYRPYDITWVLKGRENDVTSVKYNSTPSHADAPTYYDETVEGKRYKHNFEGWSAQNPDEVENPEILESFPQVSGEATYYAIYNKERVLNVGNTQQSQPQQEEPVVEPQPEEPVVDPQPEEPVVDPQPEEPLPVVEEVIDENLSFDAVSVGSNGVLTVTSDATLDATSGEENVMVQTTVEAGGKVVVEDRGVFRADEFTLNVMQEPVIQKNDQGNEALTVNHNASQVSGTGEVKVKKAYFDFTHKDGFRARTWYAVAVPWEISIPAYANGGVYAKRNGAYVPMQLGSQFDLIYYNGAARAHYGNNPETYWYCWRYVEDDIAAGQLEPAVMTPGKLYMIYLAENADVIRFEKVDTAAFHYAGKVQTESNNSATEADANWNGIANPNTYTSDMHYDDAEVGQIYVVALDEDGNPYGTYVTLKDLTQVPVGQPVFVQTTSEPVIKNQAPKRHMLKAQAEVAPKIEVQIAPIGLTYSDRIFLQTENGKADTYVIGADVAKAGVSTRFAQMWVNRYDNKLCYNTVAPVNNSAYYPLGISIVRAGDYTISVPAENLNDKVYLTYDNRIIWDLSVAPYELSIEQGVNTRYGIRIIRNNAPAVATDIENVSGEEQENGVQKVLMNNQVYVLREGVLYTITGQKAQ